MGHSDWWVIPLSCVDRIGRHRLTALSYHPSIDCLLQGQPDVSLHPVFRLFMKYWYWLVSPLGDEESQPDGKDCVRGCWEEFLFREVCKLIFKFLELLFPEFRHEGFLFYKVIFPLLKVPLWVTACRSRREKGNVCKYFLLTLWALL